MKRGRKSKGPAAEHRIIDIVFLMRYGMKAGQAFSTHPAGPLTIDVIGPGFPNSLGDMARRPGTVNGYRWVKGQAVLEKPDRTVSVNRACQLAETQFALRIPRRVRSTHLEADGSFTDTEQELSAHIAKRKNDAVAPEGSAARQWLNRALRKEADFFAGRGFDANPREFTKWNVMEKAHAKIRWIAKKDQLAERKKKKR